MQRVILETTKQPEGKFLLTSEQHHYLKRVLRLEDGDRFIALNGQGKAWIAEVAGDSAIIIELIPSPQTELPYDVTLMVALPKGNAFDEVVRCCTELGVTTILPVISDRTLLKPSPNKLARWRRIATEATEQSERCFVPTILNPIAFTTALETIPKENTTLYLCVARGESPHLLSCLSPQNHLIIAIGAEGGWTEKEIESAVLSGFQPVSLGNRILRAVTAPIVALSLVSATFEQGMERTAQTR